MTDDRRDSRRTAPTNKIIPIIGGAILLALSVVPMVLAINVSTARSLTPLESTLFTVLTFVLSTAGSAVISAYYGREQSHKNYVQLARPALRRVVALSQSAAQISGAVNSKKAAIRKNSTPSDPAIVWEWLDALSGLLQQHAGQLEAAIADWQELLPMEYRELVTLAKLQNDINERIEQIRALSAEQTQDSRESITQLTNEVARLQRQFDSASTASSIVPNYPSPKTDLSAATQNIYVGRRFSVPIEDEQGTERN